MEASTISGHIVAKDVKKFPTIYNVNRLLNSRELGLKRYVGYSNDLAALFYKSMHSYRLDTPITYDPDSCGGIFNLEYSHDGHLLLAACEINCILVHDANNQQLLATVKNAHGNCVNCIRFLEEHIFATCSDDNTIKLWDIRKLRDNGAFKTLHGHANWVKNIECCGDTMVTSAFDGSIYAWDLKSSTENGVLYDNVFTMSGLMRTKLTPDGRKMVISTTGGYMIIIHDLNLSTLAQDFKSFKPILYRLMQISGQCYPAATVNTHLFHPVRRRNRVEFIDDFPFEAEVISSLQIHPYGWCALSRSVSHNESEEMSCVHDIQMRDPSDYSESVVVQIADDEKEEAVVSDDENSATGTTTTTTDLWLSNTSNEMMHALTASNGRSHLERFPSTSTRFISTGLIGQCTQYFHDHPEDRNKIVGNLTRLTHYKHERNVGKGFIKELCFSPDGRIICSPNDRGLRLLGFSANYEEMPYCVPDRPQRLVSLVGLQNTHSGTVVCCKFNPHSWQFVSGCLTGEIVWYKPQL